MTNKEYMNVLLSLNLDHYDNKKKFFDYLLSRAIPCQFVCGRCFSGLLSPAIINPELFRKCSDIWLNSEVKEDEITKCN